MMLRPLQLWRAIRNIGWLSPDVWREMVLGQRALAFARDDLKNRPVGALLRVDDGSTTSAESADAATIRRARLIADGVTRASKYLWGSSTCLSRSIAIQKRLNDEGIHGGDLRVGVARQNGKFVAHAWVELDGRVIGDDPIAVQMYSPLDGLSISQFQ